MFGDLDKYLVVFCTGLLVTYLLTPAVRKLAIRLGVVDLPNERRPHKRPTARGGGLALVIGTHAACLVALAFPWADLAGGLDFHWWLSFMLASLVLLVVGIIDDVRGLSPPIKLAGQITAAVLIARTGVHFGTLLGYRLPELFDFLVVVVWIVGAINAFNLIDGLDGLASGLAIISGVGLCGIFFLERLPSNALVLLGLIGACLGFLRYNFHPATIFLGDTGSMFLGFMLGAISLQTFTKNTFLLSLAIPTLVLGIPIYDALLAIWRRSVRIWLQGQRGSGGDKRAGIMQPDLDHLHHRLLKTGLSTRRVATTLYLINGGLVTFGLLLATFISRAYGIFLFALLVAVFVLMRQLAVLELRDTGQAILTGLRRPTHATFKSLGYPVWDMIWMAGAVAAAMRIFEPPRSDFWHAWFLDLPIWVTPTFSLMAVSRTYLTVWTRARPLDLLMLFSTLFLGLLVSLGIALLIDPTHARHWCIRALIVGSLSHPAIIGIRMTYRAVEELVLYFRNKSQQATGGGRVLLYGAGGRCQLFLKERGFSHSSSFDHRSIIGMIDDEPTLHSQWVYGYQVLAGLQQLPRLLSKFHITQVIITATLTPEAQATVRQMARERGFRLTEWQFIESEIIPQS